MHEHRCPTDDATTVAILHRLRAESQYFVFVQAVVVLAQVFVHSAA